MKKIPRKWLFAIPLIFLAAIILRDVFFQPGISELEGGFKEVAFVRNEQNKGGIVRIYAFTVADSASANYLACGDMLPHNEYGSSTTAYFFLSNDPFPTTLQLDVPHFDIGQFHPVARYVRNEQGIATVQLTH